MTNARAMQNRDLGHNRELALQHFHRVPWTKDMTLRFQESMRDLMAGYPFLASLASSESVRYHAVDTKEFPVAATDGVGIYFRVGDGGWFDTKKYSEDHRVFAHAHEVLHVMREDCLWRSTYELTGFVSVPRTPDNPEGRLPYNDKVLGLAHDGIINATLIADKVGKPLPGIFTHPQIKPDTSTGEAYAIVYRETNGGQSLGKNGTGSGDPLSGDQRAPGSMGDPFGDSSDEASTPQPQEAATRALQDGTSERKVAIDRARNAARQAGVQSSNAEHMVDASRPPAVDWRSYFMGFVARAAGNSAYDFRRPARPPLLRDLIGEEPFFAPARGGNGIGHFVIAGDTSGSMGIDEKRATMGAISGMLRDLNPRFVTVIWCDSQVQRVDTFRGTPSEDDIMEHYSRCPIPDGGGTSFIPPFRLIDDAIKGGVSLVPNQDAIPDLLDAGKPDGFCYVTDLYGQAPSKAPDYPVLWLCTTDQPHPWGERVTFDPQELL